MGDVIFLLGMFLSFGMGWATHSLYQEDKSYKQQKIYNWEDEE